MRAHSPGLPTQLLLAPASCREQPAVPQCSDMHFGCQLKFPVKAVAGFLLCKEYKAAFREEDLFTFLFILL